MTLRDIAFVLSFAALATTPAAAKPGCVFQDAFLFTDPTPTASLIGTIPAPAPVVLVRLGPKWSIISYDGETGYVATPHLFPRSGAPADPPPVSEAFWGPTTRRELAYWRGYGRSYWTSRTNWRRATYLAPNDPAWAACGRVRVR